MLAAGHSGEGGEKLLTDEELGTDCDMISYWFHCSGWMRDIVELRNENLLRLRKYLSREEEEGILFIRGRRRNLII